MSDNKIFDPVKNPCVISNEQLIKSVDDMKTKLDTWKLGTMDIELLQNYYEGTQAFLEVMKTDLKTLEEKNGQVLIDKLEEILFHMKEMADASNELYDIFDNKLQEFTLDDVEEGDEDEVETELKKIDKNILDDLKKNTETSICKYVISRGKNKGTKCSTMCVADSEFCKKHNKK